MDCNPWPHHDKWYFTNRLWRLAQNPWHHGRSHFNKAVLDIIISCSLLFLDLSFLKRCCSLPSVKACGSHNPLTKYLVKITSSLFPFLAFIKHVFQQVVTVHCKFHIIHIVTYFIEKRDWSGPISNLDQGSI